MNQAKILQSLEKRLPNYEKFEELILKNICSSYFPLLYQSIYSQLGYRGFSNGKFTPNQFKEFLLENKFLGLVNDVYSTKLSEPVLERISNTLLEVDSFEYYEYILQKFEHCYSVIRKGKVIERSAFSLGTKLLHFYNPEENPILDSIVRDNLNLGEMGLELCLEFKKATNFFAEEHSDYFGRFKDSERVLQELEKRHMTNQFPRMQIIDMALYQSDE